MSSKGKYIGISNRIPLVILENAIADYINTRQVNSEVYLKNIQEFTKGENRAKKTLSHLTSIITKNKNLINQLAKQINYDFYSLSEMDRKAVLISFYSLTFPIAYDILLAFSVGFKVQKFISKRVVLEKMGALYGSNRSMHIGVDETIPLILDIGIIERAKKGIYQNTSSFLLENQFVCELIIYADIKLSGSKSILLKDIDIRPWYLFFDFPEDKTFATKYLISKKESSIGKGYLTIF